jgi:hypothetical protein
MTPDPPFSLRVVRDCFVWAAGSSRDLRSVKPGADRHTTPRRSTTDPGFLELTSFRDPHGRLTLFHVMVEAYFWGLQ